MPTDEKVVVRAILSLDMGEGLSVTNLQEELREVLESTGRDYGKNVAVILD